MPNQTNDAPPVNGEIGVQPFVGRADPRAVQFGVKLSLGKATPNVHGWRWRDWGDAAEFGAGEVEAKRATGFWIFCEPSE